MTLSKLDQLYRQVLLDHNQHPHHVGEITNPTVVQEGSNPSCGDQITVSMVIKDNLIQDIVWDGCGCAICKASASMMTDVLWRESLNNATELAQRFLQMTTGEDVDVKPLKEARVLAGVKQFPARIKCATLAWHAVLEGLEKVDQGGV